MHGAVVCPTRVHPHGDCFRFFFFVSPPFFSDQTSYGKLYLPLPQIATLCCWTIVEGWRSERIQFLRIFDLRTELLSYKRLLRLLVPPSLAPALLDKAYRESRGGGGGSGGGGGGDVKKGGGGTSGIAPAGGGEGGGSVLGTASAGGRRFSTAAPSDDRFAERFDEASVLFAEGGAQWLPLTPLSSTNIRAPYKS